MESKSIGSVNTILQLRLHPVIQNLKANINLSKPNKVKINYVARRDESYFKTWKGKDNLSGGLITNVGIHYLDLMTYLFGKFEDLELEINEFNKSSGKLTLENCSVEWLFSFHPEDISEHIEEGNNSHRSILLNDENIDFSDVSEDLHTTSYKNIIQGMGFTLQDAEASIAIIDRIAGADY